MGREHTAYDDELLFNRIAFLRSSVVFVCEIIKLIFQFVNEINQIESLIPLRSPQIIDK